MFGPFVEVASGFGRAKSDCESVVVVSVAWSVVLVFVIDFVVVFVLVAVEAGGDPDCKPGSCCCVWSVAGGVGGTSGRFC